MTTELSMNGEAKVVPDRDESSTGADLTEEDIFRMKSLSQSQRKCMSEMADQSVVSLADSTSNFDEHVPDEGIVDGLISKEDGDEKDEDDGDGGESDEDEQVEQVSDWVISKAIALFSASLLWRFWVRPAAPSESNPPPRNWYSQYLHL
jgi:hypothetical protein